MAADAVRALHFPLLAPPDGLPTDAAILPFDLDPALLHLLPLDPDPFPIDVAVSLFLADVIPKPCSGTGLGGLCCTSNHELAALLFEDEEVLRTAPHASGKLVGDASLLNPFSEDSITIGHHVALQFEVLELDTPHDHGRAHGIHCQEDEIGLCLNRITEVTNHIDLSADIPYHDEFMDSLCAYEDVTAEYSQIGENFSTEIASLPDHISFDFQDLPVFEADAINLDLDICFSVEESFAFMINHMTGISNQTDELAYGFNEFLMDLQIDNLVNLAPVSLRHIESQPVSSLLDLEPVNARDTSPDLYSTIKVGPFEEGSHRNRYFCFQEHEFFDTTYRLSFEMVATSTMNELGAQSEQLSSDEMLCSSVLYESVVGSELTLADESFKSLPVPVLCDKENVSLISIIETNFSELSPHQMSTCDEIYLDWHCLLEGTCSRQSCCTCLRTLTEVYTHKVERYTQDHGDLEHTIDLHYWDKCLSASNESESSGLPSEMHVCFPDITFQSPNSRTSKLIGVDKGRNEGGHLQKLSSMKVSSLFQAMSQTNDLNFFVNARRGGSGGNREHAMERKDNEEVAPASCSDSPSCTPQKTKSQCSDVEVHHVFLSDSVLVLVEKMHKCYLDILQNDIDDRYKSSHDHNENGFKLYFSKDKLVELISENMLKDPDSACRDDKTLAFSSLYAVRQLTYYLCFYGTVAAYCYISYLTRQNLYLAGKLRPASLLLKEAYCKIENEHIKCHPSLAKIESIFRSKSCQTGNKTLILAQRAFWPALTHMLSAMKIPFHKHKPNHVHYSYEHEVDAAERMDSISDALLKSDCLVISYEHLSQSFPFFRFCLIMEYGGRCESSIIFSLSNRETNLPKIIFLNTKLKEESLPKAFCEGFDELQDYDFQMKIPQSKTKCRSNILHFFECLNYIPFEDEKNHTSSETENLLERYHTNETGSDISASLLKSNWSLCSFSGTVIIVNTCTSEKALLISRRSSYQKILVLEKSGIQVVERDINLPLDLIFSASVCLVWYDSTNVCKKSESFTRSPSIPMFVELVATDVLMALSFCFHSCILVFEGESKFLAEIMESSDALYAAAASLNMHLQLFCSYSSDSTDAIILSSIEHNLESERGLYPTISESESLAECFLTRFPSLNPLSAHAILSSGGMLLDFLQWTYDRRVQAIGKYHIPDESMHLFGNLCKYGEIGDSKSETTECSSMGSEINSNKNESENKREKYNLQHKTLDLDVMDSLKVDPPSHAKQNETLDVSEVVQSRGQNSSRKSCRQKENLCDLQSIKRIKSNLLDVPQLSTRPGHLKKSADFNGEVINDESTVLNEKMPNFFDNVNFSSRPLDSGGITLPSGILNLDNFRGFKFPSPDIDYSEFCSSDDQTHCDMEDVKWPVLNNKTDPSKFNRNQGLSLPEKARHIHGSSNRGNFVETYRKKPLLGTVDSFPLQKGTPHTNNFLNKLKEKNGLSQRSDFITTLTCPGSSAKKGKNLKLKSPSYIDNFRYQGGKLAVTPSKRSWQKHDGRSADPSKDKMQPSAAITPSWTPIDKRARQNLTFARNGNEKQSKLMWRNVNIPTTDCNLHKFSENM